MKVTIFGMGNVGSMLASHLIASDRLRIDELNIHDIDEKKVKGNYHDLLDMRNVMGKHTIIHRGVSDSDVYIIAVGEPRKPGRTHDFEKNLKTVMSCIGMCKQASDIYVVTNPVERITRSLEELGIKNVIAVGNRLDTARFMRTNRDPERMANTIIVAKGFTNFGVVAEVVRRLEDG